MTATTRSCSGRLLGLLTLPWVQGPAGTVAFAGEVVEDYFVGHGGGCCNVLEVMSASNVMNQSKRRRRMAIETRQ